MVYKNMKQLCYAFLMMVLILLMVVNTTIAGATIRSSNASTYGDLSKEHRTTISASGGNSFQVFFGVIITDAIFTDVIFWPDEDYYIFFLHPLDRVAVIGFGAYNGSEVNEHFYMKTFYNVSSVMGGTYKEVAVTDQYQTIVSFHTRVTPCILYFN
jgi:hypothetical protein